MAETDTEVFILVLAALYKANPRLTIDYKAMAELSGGKRTHVAYEHKVRPWRQRAQAILAASNGGGDGAAVASPSPKKRGTLTETPSVGSAFLTTRFQAKARRISLRRLQKTRRRRESQLRRLANRVLKRQRPMHLIT